VIRRWPLPEETAGKKEATTGYRQPDGALTIPATLSSEDLSKKGSVT
jgi:hypothetical protein